MNDNNEIIASLRDKIKAIISLYEKEQEIKQNLENKNKVLSDRLKQLEKRSGEMEERYENLKLAKTLSNGSDNSHEAKIKVNRIVREIDKCIALLNR